MINESKAIFLSAATLNGSHLIEVEFISFIEPNFSISIWTESVRLILHMQKVFALNFVDKTRLQAKSIWLKVFHHFRIGLALTGAIQSFDKHSFDFGWYSSFELMKKWFHSKQNLTLLNKNKKKNI